MTRLRALLLSCGLLVSADLRGSEPFAITDEFVGYIKSAANPKEFGLTQDDRFFPYSTPQGRRIGWRQPVTDKAWFAEGWPKADAERQLRADLERALAEAGALVAKQRPARSFEALPPAAQEILVDFAHSEGAANLRPDFVEAVLAADWRRLIERHLYVRSQGVSPDMSRNKAFADRWIYSERLMSLRKPAGVSAPTEGVKAPR